LGNLATQLRSYQVEGIEWLNKLYNNGLQGLLADEMGLGKTVQTLGFLRQLRGPKLVVCPASLTLNWQREAERFTPELRAVRSETLTGDELIKLCGEDRLLISSYGLLRRDIDCLQQAEFAAIALDEAQHIKNPDSQTARAAHRLRAPARLALTGTPIENGVRDIWSIMHFLMPGYLGDRERFRERFEVPIQTRPGGPEHRRLVQRLRPFILRRTKREVAKDLPDKIQQVSYCELTSNQKDLYGKLLKAARQRITEASDSKTGGQAKLAAFTALLRLRQVCCDLQLLGDELADSAASSAKRELLSELLDEAITDGHRVLVFSQFASMLRLIAKDLEQVGVRYCYLDGATRNRQAEVDRFQSGDAPVFLISLKAGGVGLNLTAADTVILFDPWWNPAVEAQATDRAHRIGQQRTVNVYRLIARGTVEEKILRLQEKKRAMADELVVDSEEPMMSGLTMEDFAELVS
jgi:SNF2 family DNA or RNA helicase